MSRSQLVAITVALRELGREVEVNASGAEVVLVQPGSPADGDHRGRRRDRRGEGEEVESIDELRRHWATSSRATRSS